MFRLEGNTGTQAGGVDGCRLCACYHNPGSMAAHGTHGCEPFVQSVPAHCIQPVANLCLAVSLPALRLFRAWEYALLQKSLFLPPATLPEAGSLATGI